MALGGGKSEARTAEKYASTTGLWVCISSPCDSAARRSRLGLLVVVREGISHRLFHCHRVSFRSGSDLRLGQSVIRPPSFPDATHRPQTSPARDLVRGRGPGKPRRPKAVALPARDLGKLVKDQYDAAHIVRSGKYLQSLQASRPGDTTLIHLQGDRGAHEERPSRSETIAEAFIHGDGLLGWRNCGGEVARAVVTLAQGPEAVGDPVFVAKLPKYWQRLLEQSAAFRDVPLGHAARERVVVERVCDLARVTAGSRQREALVVVGLAVVHVALPVGDPAGGFQGTRPIEGVIVSCRHGQDRIQPSPTFAQMCAHLPETPQPRAAAKPPQRSTNTPRTVEGR